MTQFPNADDLLAGVERFLKEQIVPSIDDRGLRFRARIAVHLVATARRELGRSVDVQQREAESLAALKELPVVPSDLDTLAERVDWLNEALAEGLRNSKISIEDEDVYAHLMRTLAEQLQVSQPRFDLRINCEHVPDDNRAS